MLEIEKIVRDSLMNSWNLAMIYADNKADLVKANQIKNEFEDLVQKIIIELKMVYSGINSNGKEND